MPRAFVWMGVSTLLTDCAQSAFAASFSDFTRLYGTKAVSWALAVLFCAPSFFFIYTKHIEYVTPITIWPHVFLPPRTVLYLFGSIFFISLFEWDSFVTLTSWQSARNLFYFFTILMLNPDGFAFLFSQIRHLFPWQNGRFRILRSHTMTWNTKGKIKEGLVNLSPPYLRPPKAQKKCENCVSPVKPRTSHFKRM